MTPFLLALVTGLCSGAPAQALPLSAGSSDDAVLLGSAAAEGAADAASGVRGDDVARAAAALGGAAATVVPAGKSVADATDAPDAGAGPVWTWNGWVSGASGAEAVDGSFGTWRGKPLGLGGTWADRSEYAQTQMTGVSAYSSFDGEMDVAVGALVKGETWEQAAAGQFVTRWTTAARNLEAMRGGKGTTYVRIAHEMNGDWMVWGVNSKNLDAYLKGYRLYASIIRKEFPEARLTWSPNGGNHTDVSIDQLWPGNDVVDVIAPNIYDFSRSATTLSSWAKESTAWLTPQSPTGLEAWRQYAARRGKPIALAEWGLASGDDPEWIRQVHNLMANNAAGHGTQNAAGKFVYDCYFNAEDSFKLLNGSNPNAATMYKSLTWGS